MAKTCFIMQIVCGILHQMALKLDGPFYQITNWMFLLSKTLYTVSIQFLVPPFFYLCPAVYTNICLFHKLYNAFIHQSTYLRDITYIFINIGVAYLDNYGIYPSKFRSLIWTYTVITINSGVGYSDIYNNYPSQFMSLFRHTCTVLPIHNQP